MRSTLLAVALIACQATPTNNNNNDTTTDPPSGLSYPNAPFHYTVGVAIEQDSPSWDGGTPTAFAVDPALPAGINLDTKKGGISGTPIAASVETEYTVTASNEAGNTTTKIKVSVAAAPLAPSGLTYTQSDIHYVLNTDIPTNHATLAVGTAPITYTVAPDLPAGLSLNSSSGDITGKPDGSALSTMVYVVTATNAQGHTTASLHIGIDATAQPPNLTGYTTNNANYFIGVEIDANSPVATGQPATHYVIAPTTLPTGLAMNADTGVITGTPTDAADPAQTFTITASNGAGNDPTPVTITIHVAAPTKPEVSYDVHATYCTPGTAIPDAVPAVTGTSVVFTLDPSSPPLPNGVSIQSNGTLHGRPTDSVTGGPFVFLATSGALATTGLIDVHFTGRPAAAGDKILTMTINTNALNGPTETDKSITVGQTVAWSFVAGTNPGSWTASVAVAGFSSPAAISAGETYPVCFNSTGDFSWSTNHISQTNASGTIHVSPVP